MSRCTITLPESLDVSEVALFQSDLINKLNEFDEFKIDDSQIVNIDTAGVQLLLAFALEIKTNNKSISWENPAEVISTSFKQLAVTDLIFN